MRLDNGASPNAQNDRGESPVHWAARYGFDEVVKYLMRAGGDAELVGTQIVGIATE